MATIIWKDGKSEMCNPLHLHAQLQAGYSLTNGDDNASLPPKKEDKKDLSEKETYEKELRQAAKAYKIKNWHNKKIEKLEIEVSEASNLSEDNDTD